MAERYYVIHDRVTDDLYGPFDTQSEAWHLAQDLPRRKYLNIRILQDPAWVREYLAKKAT